MESRAEHDAAQAADGAPALTLLAAGAIAMQKVSRALRSGRLLEAYELLRADAEREGLPRGFAGHCLLELARTERDGGS